MASRFSTVAANTAADAIAALLDGGFLRLYDGTRPTTAESAVTNQVLLAEIAFGDPAFGAAVGGIATANALTAEDSALATGTATWFRCVTNGGASVFDGSIGIAGDGANLTLNDVAIELGASVSISAGPFTTPKE